MSPLDIPGIDALVPLFIEFYTVCNSGTIQTQSFWRLTCMPLASIYLFIPHEIAIVHSPRDVFGIRFKTQNVLDRLASMCMEKCQTYMYLACLCISSGMQY